MKDRDVEKTLDILLEKMLTEEGKDEGLVGLSILFRKGFYGIKPKPTTFKKLMGTFISMIKKEKNLELKEFAIFCLTILIRGWICDTDFRIFIA